MRVPVGQMHRRLYVFRAGAGESTTELAWDGHALIYENSDLLAESERFSDTRKMIHADIDLGRLVQDRMRVNSFTDAIDGCREKVRAIRRIDFTFEVSAKEVPLIRNIDRFPYVPSELMALDDRCYEVYNIQVHALSKRLTATGIKKLVIGVSGGLDSTQALIVCAMTMDRLNLSRENILAYTMPGFATSAITNRNARHLMEYLGVSVHEMDIRPSARQMLKISDIRIQRVKRSMILPLKMFRPVSGPPSFPLGQLQQWAGGGTGDLSELALGWSTYGWAIRCLIIT